MVADPLTKSEADNENILQIPMTTKRQCIHSSTDKQLAKKRKALSLRGELKRAKKGDLHNSRAHSTAPRINEAYEQEVLMDPSATCGFAPF